MLSRLTRYVSPGFMVISVVAAVTTVLVLMRRTEEAEGITFWTFATSHHDMYQPLVEEWNRTEEVKIDLKLLHGRAIERRMMSGFFAGTPVAGLIEGNQQYMNNAWRGPEEAVGFVDIKPLLERDGLYEEINPPSLTPWSNEGHQYGLPHDVHPTVLAYRADLIEEEAGIDMSAVETWDQFMAAVEPLLADLDGDGRRDRFALELPESIGGMLEILLLQGGGGVFTGDNVLVLDSDRNVDMLSQMAVWHAQELAVDIPFGSGAGNRQLIDGVALAWLTPDWRVAQFIRELGPLEGKLKLMPLPAWEPGGRRTSVWGGTMLGLPKANGRLETRWKMAKHIYFSEVAAEKLFETAYIISPIKRFWDNPVYHQPDPFFNGQKVGSLFIELAPEVPERASTPFIILGSEELGNAFNKLVRYAKDIDAADPNVLKDYTRELLVQARRNLEAQMERVGRFSEMGGES